MSPPRYKLLKTQNIKNTKKNTQTTASNVDPKTPELAQNPPTQHRSTSKNLHHHKPPKTTHPINPPPPPLQTHQSHLNNGAHLRNYAYELQIAEIQRLQAHQFHGTREEIVRSGRAP